jgi:hypothetical protein
VAWQRQEETNFQATADYLLFSLSQSLGQSRGYRGHPSNPKDCNPKKRERKIRQATAIFLSVNNRLSLGSFCNNN